MKQHLHDVIVLGSGIGGASMASILARRGFDVLILEKGGHPRFAIGEAMLPQMSMMCWIVGERFGVPELKHLASIEGVREQVSASCGIKRSIGFLYHEQGQRQDPRRSHQLIPPLLPGLSESHLYRAEVDQQLLAAAVRYGADYCDHTEVEDVSCTESEVRVRVKGGEEHTARYLVDATGFRSLLADRLQLREPVTRLQTPSRSIFTHLTGVRPYDRLLRTDERTGQSHGWHEGTLHHVFDGGWFWVIPFDNWQTSPNACCSLGLTLDLRKFPPSGLPPEREFWQIVDRYPSIREHLAGATPARPWVGTGRLQYSSRRCTGPRCCLLSHSYGFIDPLFSGGMLNTFETIHALASRLIAALQDDDFAAERFSYMEALQHAQLEYDDMIVNSSYLAMRQFELWNAWLQTWLVTKLFNDVWINRFQNKYIESGNRDFLAAVDETPQPCAQAPFAARMQSLVKGASTMLQQVTAGTLDAKVAADTMLEALRQQDWLPHSLYPFGDPRPHHVDFTQELLEALFAWAHTSAPTWLRDEVFDFDPLVALRAGPHAGGHRA